jgi:hypothetical protein
VCYEEVKVNNNSPVGKPRPACKLTGTDGNAFSVMGAVSRALGKAGYSKEEIESYVASATSGDYNHLLAVSMLWVDVR